MSRTQSSVPATFDTRRGCLCGGSLTRSTPRPAWPIIPPQIHTRPAMWCTRVRLAGGVHGAESESAGAGAAVFV